MSSQGSFLSARSWEFACALLWCSVWCWLHQLKCGCARTVCLTQWKRKCQMVMISYFATTLLLQRHEQRYKFVVKEVCQLLHKSTFDVRTGGVPRSPKELLNNSWLCQMSWCIFPIIAQKLRSPCLSSQKRLWTLHCTFQKSFLVLGSLNPDADAVDSRRTEEVKVRTMLCALAHERQCFELNAHSSEAPQISTCIWKTLLHLCFFHMPVLDGCESQGFQLGYPRNFLV